jgi:hypothetical protein
MTDIAQAVTIAIGIALGIVVGWWVRGWFVADERDRLRAKLADCEARLDAVTLHTMARRQARAEASRKGWQTKRERQEKRDRPIFPAPEASNGALVQTKGGAE